MGKNLIIQKRGRGTSTYRAPSFRYKGKSEHRKYDNETVSGIVSNIIHCPGHSAPLIEIKYENGETCLMVAPEGIKIGDEVCSGSQAKLNNGNSLALENIPEGTLIYNIESVPGDGGCFVRSSGTFAKIISKSQGKVTVLLPSRKIRVFDSRCRATIGVVAASGRTEKPFVKAGKKYHYMRARNKLYPRVCGVSMNAVDHPFGGSSSHHKGRPTIAPRFAPPGRNVGKIRPSRTGRRKR